MFRRDFLKSFFAASAAIAAGGGIATTAISAASPARRPLPPTPRPCDPCAELVSILKKARCVSIERIVSINGPTIYRTEFRDENDPFGANINDEAWRLLANARPLNISVTCESQEDIIDVSMLGERRFIRPALPWLQPVRIIEVEWMAP